MGTVKRCEWCSRKIVMRKKECDEDGTIYHARCFRCGMCNAETCMSVLNEYNVNVRNEKILCKDHGRWYGKSAPLCKVYYISFNTAYRIIRASDKDKGGDEEEEEEEEEEEGGHRRRGRGDRGDKGGKDDKGDKGERGEERPEPPRAPAEPEAEQPGEAEDT